jgi:hypothetical protein
MKFEVEQIDDNHQRAKVPGGWIVKAYEDVIHITPEHDDYTRQGWDFRVAMCFVPDPKHEWVID